MTDGARDRQRIKPLPIREAPAINDLGQILVSGKDLRNHNEAVVLAAFDFVLAWRRFRPATAGTSRPC